jgi:hypothetical protein
MTTPADVINPATDQILVTLPPHIAGRSRSGQHPNTRRPTVIDRIGRKPMTTTFDVINPATEQIVTTVPLTSLTDTDTARATTEPWRAIAPADREHLADRTFVLSAQQRQEQTNGNDRLDAALITTARTKATR